MLGVNDKTTNWGVTSELGKPPSITLIIDRMIKFWSHAIQSKSPLLKAALQTSVNLDAAGKRVWFTFLRRCLKFIGIDHILYTSDPKEVMLQVMKTKKLLQCMANREWINKQSKTKSDIKAKLNLFSHIKQGPGLSDYLSLCTNQNVRISLTKFRLSAHNLPVEIHRYNKLSRGDRICPFCSTGIGDEQHYLCVCPNILFKTQREPLLEYIENKFPEFQDLDMTNKTRFLLRCTDPTTLRKIGQFCRHVIDVFKESNSKTI